MMRRLGLGLAFVMSAGALLIACTGEQGPDGLQGAKGEKGDNGQGTASVSAVTPSSAFLARTIDVTISGNGTSWSDKAVVDFGAKVKVNKITAASETALVANITVAGDAPPGPIDVSVTDEGGDKQIYKGAFELVSPLKLTVEGSVAQGSVVHVHARGLDFTTPFDTTATGDGLFTPLEFTNLQIATSPGVSTNISNASDYTVDYTMFIDVDATAGKQAVDIASGVTGDTVDFPSPGALDLTARPAVDLVPGTAGSATLANLGDSALFKYTPSSADLKIVEFALSSTDPNGSPAAYFLPKSGKFADALAASSGFLTATASQDLFYAVMVDAQGYAGYKADIKVTETAAQGGPEHEPNDSMSDATSNGSLALPYVVQNATLSNELDEDWFAITLKASDVGKKIHVVTYGDDSQTDTVVDILDASKTSLGGPSDDSGYLDSLTSDAITGGGTYFVKIYASSYFDSAHGKYSAIIRLK